MLCFNSIYSYLYIYIYILSFEIRLSESVMQSGATGPWIRLCPLLLLGSAFCFSRMQGSPSVGSNTQRIKGFVSS